MGRRYKLSGVVKFSDDHYIFDNEDKARDMFKEIFLLLNDSSVNVYGKVDLIEKNVEDLGPATWVEGVRDYITTCECEHCNAARNASPEDGQGQEQEE